MASGPAAGMLKPVRPRFGARTLLSFFLLLAFMLSVVAVQDNQGLLHDGGLAAAANIMASRSLLDLSPSFLRTVVEATLLTVAYAVAGMSVAIVIGLPGAVAISGIFFRRSMVRAGVAAGGRGMFASLRAFHELIWALLFVVVLGLSPLSGILAIGVPYGATIARVLGERLQDVESGPIAALRSSGASSWQVLTYGHAPMIAADAVAYLFYRCECAIRSAAVLSFVGLGGIGYRMEIALADLRFDQVWTLAGALVIAIVGVDRLSRAARRGWIS